MCKILIENGANVNSVDDEVVKATPIHYATMTGIIPLIKLLLGKGSDVNSKSSGNWTPLYIATSSRKKEAIEFLVQNGAEIDSEDE